MGPTTPPCTRPVADATTPFWRTELHDLDSFRSTPELPQECDIAIIGSGFAGVSTAYHILQDNDFPPSIVILEARGACSGASARNGGHVKPDVYYNILKYTKKYGAEAAASFALFEAANVFAVKQLVEKEKIDCDFVLTRAVDAYLDTEHAKATEEAYRELVRIGVADLGDVQLKKGEDAEKISGIKDTKCTFSFTAAHLWPYKLVMGVLAKLVEGNKVNLQTHTPVKSISHERDSEGRWTVTTDRGTIRAKKLILATNGYTAAVAPQFHEKIVPVRGICSRIVAPDSAKPRSRLTNSYSIRYGTGIYDYMIPRLDGSIIIGGAKPRFWADKSQWYGVTDDSKLIEPATTYFDGLMQRRFNGWEKSGAKTDMVWTGIMGWTSDFMPYVGEVPEKPGQMIIAGFSGHGMPLICLASKAMAEMVKGVKKFEDTELPFIFKPTVERLESKENEILGVKTRSTSSRL